MLLGAVISFTELWQLDLLAGLFDGGSSEFRAMIAMTYSYEALGAIPLGLNSAVLALLYGIGETRLTLVLNFARVFIFRIPVFWYLQNYTGLGDKSVGAVMMISNISAGVSAAVVAAMVLYKYKRKYNIDR
jgi:Na+-driven multidrug efflux pump